MQAGAEVVIASTGRGEGECQACKHTRSCCGALGGMGRCSPRHPMGSRMIQKFHRSPARSDWLRPLPHLQAHTLPRDCDAHQSVTRVRSVPAAASKAQTIGTNHPICCPLHANSASSQVTAKICDAPSSLSLPIHPALAGNSANLTIAPLAFHQSPPPPQILPSSFQGLDAKGTLPLFPHGTDPCWRHPAMSCPVPPVPSLPSRISPRNASRSNSPPLCGRGRIAGARMGAWTATRRKKRGLRV